MSLVKKHIKFKKKLKYTNNHLHDIILDRFKDIHQVEIIGDVRSDKIKEIIFTCENTTPKDLLDFVRMDFILGFKVMSVKDKPIETSKPDIQKTCQSLGSIFETLFGDTGSAIQTIADISTRLDSLEKQLLGINNALYGDKVEKTKETSKGLVNIIEEIKKDAGEEVAKKIKEINDNCEAEKKDFESKKAIITSIEKRCEALENHLIGFPVFKRAVNEPTRARK